MAEAFEIRALEPRDDGAYAAFVASCADANVYHGLAWRAVIVAAYGYRPRYLGAWSGGTLRGVLPLFEIRTLLGGHRFVATPFSHHVPVLAETATVRDALGTAARAMARGARYLELRHGSPIACEGLVDGVACHGTRLDLGPPVETLRAGLHASQVRRAVSKAERSDLEVLESDALEDFEAYHALQLEARHRQGAPPYPRQFFASLHRELAGRGVARVWLARHGGRVIAGIVVLGEGESAIYGYGASTRDPEVTRMRPNHLLFWRAILAARERGHRWFDFGSTPLGHETLLRFKSGWGGESAPLVYQMSGAESRGATAREGLVARAGAAALRRAPAPVYRTLGPLLMRQFG